MRRLHRWFGLVTGVFMALIALSGIGMQVIDLIWPEHPGPRGGPPGGLPRGPDPAHGLHQFRAFMDHLHDGELLGYWGRIVSLALGLALLLFSVSGIWMYWTMYSARRRNGMGKVFW
jgi:uncharacterized iron-regulated membrane protein